MNEFPVGEILTSPNRIQWKISNFLQLPHEPNSTLMSQVFIFEGLICILQLSPNGYTQTATEGWLGLECEMYSLGENSPLRCSVLDHWGREILHTEMEKVGSVTYQVENWIRLTELMSRKEEILPHGQLHIVCTVLREGHNSVDESETDDKFAARNSDDPKDSSHATNDGLGELSQTLKNLYIESRDCDVIIRVKDSEFHAHRLLLRARSPAFNAMLSHNMLENNSGIITIEDCDANIFNNFLIYLYSGKLENLTTDNMCGLYQLADKYDVPVLKDMCLKFMVNSLSVKTVCDIIWLADRHEEFELLIHAVVFFLNNVEEIQRTAKWLSFMGENAALANALFQEVCIFYKRKFSR